MPTAPGRARPKYLAIADELRARILGTRLGAGGRLPSQRELATIHGVTVMTIRQALDVLARDGMVVTAKGQGTFVRQRPLQYRLDTLGSFAQEMADQGVRLRTRLLSCDVVPADAKVGRALGLGPGEEVARIERLRLTKGRPIAYQRSYVPAALGARLVTVDLERRSLYDVLGHDVGRPVTQAVETIRATTLTAQAARHLRRRRGALAIAAERVSLDAPDTPLVFDVALLPADCTEVVAERVADRTLLSYRLS
jgi:GntR family transcriptional regulator